MERTTKGKRLANARRLKEIFSHVKSVGNNAGADAGAGMHSSRKASIE
jgi:hypothetical protein